MIDDFLEEAAAELESERKRAWRKNPKFLAIQGVTKQDLLEGSAYIEKLKWPPWDKRNDSKGAAQTNQTNLVGYGKYSQKSFEWVKENDYRYFEWMCENVDKFRVKAKQLGLI